MRETLIPLLTLLIGIISLFANPENIKSPGDLLKNKKILFLIVLLVSSFGINSFFAYSDSQEQQEQIEYRNGEIKDLKDILRNFESRTASSFSSIREVLASFGFRKDSKISLDKLDRSLQAETARKKLISKTGKDVGGSITVKFFPKDVDREVVSKALSELNFKIVYGNAANPIPTNSIWFGKNATDDQIKSVALTLIRAGVDLKQIEQFRTSNGGRDDMIQVGATPDQAVRNGPSILLEDIINTSTFR